MLDRPAPPKPIVVGKPALLVIDIQKASFMDFTSKRLPLLPDRKERLYRVRPLIDAARAASVPIIFFKEVHRPNMIDFGRELDGTEDVHCLENLPATDFAFEEMDIRPDDYKLAKRRYSCFFGTELEILLRGLKINTLILTGGFTDVCVHYTFVDGHQHDYYCRVVEDCVSGSSPTAHEASLRAMEYLQTGARRQSSEVLNAFSARIAGSALEKHV